MKIRGFNAWDAIKAYIQSGIPAPISPVSKTDPDVVAGQQLFSQAGCNNCHGTALWTTSRVRYTPPADPSLIQNTELIAELRPVGTFNPQGTNEVRQNAAAPLGADGFNTPSLLSIFAFPQTFFHGGAAASFDDVLANVAHRTAGLPAGATDPLASASALAQLEKFLNSIDGNTPPVNPPAPASLTLVNHFNYTGTSEAPQGIVDAYTAGLAAQFVAAPSPTLPSELGGVTAAVKDSAGVLRLAPLYFVSPGELAFVLNPGTAIGSASVTVTPASGATSAETIQVAPVAPGIASTNPNGAGVAIATAVRLAADGVTETPVNVFQCSGAACTATPIDVSTGTVYVSFYGTGFRGVSSLANANCTIGGVPATVLFAGAQGQFSGLDQLNVQLPGLFEGPGV